MGLEARRIRYGQNEAFTGYLAHPSRAPEESLPGVVVIPEAWGLNEHIEDVTRRMAMAGYTALGVDLHSRDGERPAPFHRDRMAELLAFFEELPMAHASDPKAREEALSKRPSDEQARLRDSIGAVFGSIGSLERYLPPVLEGLAFLRANGRSTVTMGFCMGGSLAALAACHDPDLRGAAAFYGTAPPETLIPNIRCKVIALCGSEDARIMAGVPALKEAMRSHGKPFEVHVYEGAQHAFFNDTRRTYDAIASRKAFATVLRFFDDMIG